MPDDLLRVERELEAAVQTGSEALTMMAGHLMAAGGKRIRPMFTLAAAACQQPVPGPATAEAVRGGVAVELVHLGSLYHDDVIDEAVTRRTVESANARWGNLRAILSGDFLLAKASELAASLGTEVAGLLAATIGRLCEGEVVELQHAYQLDRSEAAYFAAIEGKTAALFSAAGRIGALVQGLDHDAVDRLTAFGTAYGTAFQIVDDILDVIATDEQMGKPTGRDLAEGVYTLPVLQALQMREGDELRDLLGRPIEGPELDKARAIVGSSPGIAAAGEAVRDNIGEARRALGPLVDQPSGAALAGAADHLLEALRLS
jgi:heptaprenyl diphosphate synthase